MSEIETFDELEAGLRRAFRREPLPVAPDRLRAGLVDIVDQGAPRASARRRSRSAFGVLGVAAVVIVGGALAIFGGGGIRPGPSRPADGTPSGIPATRITYGIEWTTATPPSDAAGAAISRVLGDRLSAIGLTTAGVTRLGTDRVAVDVPSSADLARVRRILLPIGRVAFVPLGQDQAEAGDPIDPALPALVGGDQIERASIETSQDGSRVVDFHLGAEGTRLFGDWTRDHVGERFAIAVDGTILSAPRISSEIPGGDVQVTQPGGWDRTNAEDLVAVLGSGELPVAIHEVSVESVGPILPAEPSASSEPIVTAPPSSAPPTQVARPEIRCEPPSGVPGELSCEDAIGRAVVALPADARIASISFIHECDDSQAFHVTDCFVQGQGRVTVTLDDGSQLALFVGSGAPVFLLPRGLDPEQISDIAPTAPDACGTTDEAPAPYRLHIPGDGSPITATSSSGQTVDVVFGVGYSRLAAPLGLLLERVGRAGGSAILGADGNVVLIGTRAGPGTLQTCLTTDGSIMAIGIPATR